MYVEILELYEWCMGHSIPCVLSRLFDGYKLEFPDKADFVQHAYSYGSAHGGVEPAGFTISFEGVSLETAKKLIQEKSYGKIKSEV